MSPRCQLEERHVAMSPPHGGCAQRSRTSSGDKTQTLTASAFLSLPAFEMQHRDSDIICSIALEKCMLLMLQKRSVSQGLRERKVKFSFYPP